MTQSTLKRDNILGRPRLRSRLAPLINLIVMLVVLATAGCGMINPGKFIGIEHTDRDEQFYLVKKLWLTAGSTAHPRTFFDHTMQDGVYVVFVPANEPNHYVTKTVWYDPSGSEFRTIRQTHDKQAESAKGIDRPKSGSTIIHMMPLEDMWKHKPGLWKVELFIDNKLARRLTFNVR